MMVSKESQRNAVCLQLPVQVYFLPWLVFPLSDVQFLFHYEKAKGYVLSFTAHLEISCYKSCLFGLILWSLLSVFLENIPIPIHSIDIVEYLYSETKNPDQDYAVLIKRGYCAFSRVVSYVYCNFSREFVFVKRLHLSFKGRHGDIKLIDPEQLICYQEVSHHKKAIDALVFHPHHPTWLFSMSCHISYASLRGRTERFMGPSS